MSDTVIVIQEETSVVEVSTPGVPGPTGEGVPAGGTEGQVLKKASAADFDTEWEDEAGGGAHTHAGEDITSGTIADARIAATIARDAEVLAAILAALNAADGNGLSDNTAGVLSVNVDGTTIEIAGDALQVVAGVFAAAVHVHSGADITSGTVAEARIDAAIARDTEVTAAIQAAIDALIDSSPGTLDTLNELAAALGDDPNFAATVTAALAGKQPIDSDLTAIAALATTSFGRGLLTLADAAALLAAAGAAAATITLTAGNGLSGGGDLSASRTFTVNVDDSTIELSGDALRVKAGGITANEIAPNAVGSSELADDAVDTAAIQDDAVTVAKISSGAATDGQVMTADGAGGAVFEDPTGEGSVAADDENLILHMEVYA